MKCDRPFRAGSIGPDKHGAISRCAPTGSGLEGLDKQTAIGRKLNISLGQEGAIARLS